MTVTNVQQWKSVQKTLPRQEKTLHALKHLEKLRSLVVKDVEHLQKRVEESIHKLTKINTEYPHRKLAHVTVSRQDQIFPDQIPATLKELKPLLQDIKQTLRDIQGMKFIIAADLSPNEKFADYLLYKQRLLSFYTHSQQNPRLVLHTRFEHLKVDTLISKLLYIISLYKKLDIQKHASKVKRVY